MATHGLASTYRSGCRCEPCTDANTEHCRNQREKRADRPESEIPHGLSGYRNWGHRCNVCRAAGSASNARYHARRKAGAK